MKFTIEWLKAAGIRMLRTAAQTALTMFSIGMALKDIDWKMVASVAIVSALYSLLTSIVTELPEVGNDGTIYIENNEIAGIDIDDTSEKKLKAMAKNKMLKLKVQEVDKTIS